MADFITIDKIDKIIPKVTIIGYKGMTGYFKDKNYPYAEYEYKITEDGYDELTGEYKSIIELELGHEYDVYLDPFNGIEETVKLATKCSLQSQTSAVYNTTYVVNHMVEFSNFIGEGEYTIGPIDGIDFYYITSNAPHGGGTGTGGGAGGLVYDHTATSVRKAYIVSGAGGEVNNYFDGNAGETIKNLLINKNEFNVIIESEGEGGEGGLKSTLIRNGSNYIWNSSNEHGKVGNNGGNIYIDNNSFILNGGNNSNIKENLGGSYYMNTSKSSSTINPSVVNVSGVKQSSLQVFNYSADYNGIISIRGDSLIPEIGGQYEYSHLNAVAVAPQNGGGGVLFIQDLMEQLNLLDIKKVQMVSMVKMALKDLFKYIMDFVQYQNLQLFNIFKFNIKEATI